MANYYKSPTVSLRMPKEIVELILTRRPGQPWGFSLAGGKDKGQSLKVGSVQDDSPAERAGLRTKDFLWRVAGRDVLADEQATVAGLVRAAATELRITVERGDHIVPSFQELFGLGSKKSGNGTAKSSRALSGAAYYREAMEDHGLGKNIPTAFTTVGGRPWVENIQYNSPIEVYNKDTIVEMVKVMDSGETPCIIYISVENEQSWHRWKQINLLNFSLCHVLNIVKV